MPTGFFRGLAPAAFAAPITMSGGRTTVKNVAITGFAVGIPLGSSSTI